MNTKTREDLKGIVILLFWFMLWVVASFAAVDDSYSKVLLHFDGNFTDQTGKTWSLNGAGASATSTYKFGSGSLYTDGLGSIYTADSDDFDYGTGDFTIDLWMKTNSGSQAFLLYQGDSNGTHTTVGTFLGISAAGMSPSKIGFSPDYTNYPAHHLLESTTGINDNVWHHIAAVKASETYTLYIDGVAEASATFSYTHLNSAYPMYCGSMNTIYSYYKGYMDEVRISKGIARWTSNFTPPTRAYVPATTDDEFSSCLLHFDTDFSDSAEPTRSWSSVGGPAISATRSRFGNGSLFIDGSTEYITVPGTDNGFNFGTQDFTIDFWVNFNSAYVSERMIDKMDNLYSPNQWFVGTENPGSTRMSMCRGKGGSDYEFLQASSTCDANRWYHVAVVRHGATGTIYIDGVAGNSWSDYTNDLTSSAAVRIGHGSWWPNTTNAYIDEMRVSKGIARWTSNFTPPTAPYQASAAYDANTLAMLHFDGASSTTLLKDEVSVNTWENSGTAFTVATYVFGDSCLDVPLHAYAYTSSSAFDIIGTGDYTLEFWSQSQADNGPVMARLGNVLLHTPIDHDNDLVYYYYSGGWTFLYGNDPVRTNQWYHLALIRNAGNVYVSVNGQLSNVRTGDAITGFGDIFIGRNPDWSTSNNFDGLIDELRVSNVARWVNDFTPPTTPYGPYTPPTPPASAANPIVAFAPGGRISFCPIVTASYTPGLATDTNTLAYLKFDGDLTDQAGNTWTAAGNATATLSEHALGSGSLMVWETTDSLTCNNTFDLATSDFTIEGWVSLPNYSGANYSEDLFRQSDSASSYTVLTVNYINNNPVYGYTITFGIYDPAPVFTFSTAISGVYSGWQHIALTRSGSTWRMFFNGVLKTTATSSVSIPSYAATSIKHAYGTTNFCFIDEFRLSSVARWTIDFTPPTSQYTGTGYATQTFNIYTPARIRFGGTQP